MRYCGQCLEVMKPLFTGFFCPNDCDRKTKAQSGCLDAWKKISARMPVHLVSQLEHVCKLNDKVVIWKEHGGRWWCLSSRPMNNQEVLTADVIIALNCNEATVTKNRFGGHTIDELMFA